MHNRAANVYRRVYLESATPTRVLDELYGRLLRDCASAREAILARDVPRKATEIGHALEILDCLSGSLDAAAAPEVAEGLGSLYRFCSARLTAASASLDATPLADVERIVTELQATFRQAAGSAA